MEKEKEKNGVEKSNRSDDYRPRRGIEEGVIDEGANII